jgi:DNA-binding MarR family transcriptional regulator
MNLTNLRGDLRVLEREIDLLLKSEAGCCGVTMIQCHVLLELVSAENVSLKELEERLQTDKAALSRTVETLVQEGLAERRPNDKDRRFVRVALTQEGREKAAAINETCNRSYTALFAQIPGEKHDIVAESIGLLSRAMAGLRKSIKSGDGGFCCLPISRQN